MFVKEFRVKRLLAAVLTGVLALSAAGGCWLYKAREAIAPEPAQKTVYLTFDDGPSAVTADLLDLLKEKEVKATFFVIGATTERGKALYQRILDEGHALGLHSYSHRYNDIYASADSFMEDLLKLREHVCGITGYEANIFRFPGGSTNATAPKSVISSVKEITGNMGMRYFDWNALGKDDKSKPSSPESIFQSVKETGKDRDTILILMHDDALRTTAPQALEKIIDYYTAKGYVFERLTKESPDISF